VLGGANGASPPPADAGHQLVDLAIPKTHDTKHRAVSGQRLRFAGTSPLRHPWHRIGRQQCCNAHPRSVSAVNSTPAEASITTGFTPRRRRALGRACQ
jgi:hypothetical protein